MSSRSAPPPGSLAAAIAPLRPPDAPVERADAAVCLADLIDLPGGVALAEALEALADATPTRLGTPADDEGPLRARVRAELSAIEARLTDALENAFRPRYRLPGALRAHAVLEQAGALRTRKGRAVATAARTLWAPFNEFLETHLKRARFALRDLRIEIGPALRARGGDAARIEALDAALEAATRPAVDRLYRRALAALEARFEAELRESLRDLPAGATPDHLAPAFAPGGWAPAQLELGATWVRAVVDRERHRLEALVEAGLGAG